MADEVPTSAAVLERPRAVRADVLSSAQATEVKFALPFGFAALAFGQLAFVHILRGGAAELVVTPRGSA